MVDDVAPDATLCRDCLQLTDIATKVPDDVSLYDLNTAAPGLNLPRSDALEEMLSYGKAHMDELLADVRSVDVNFTRLICLLAIRQLQLCTFRWSADDC